MTELSNLDFVSIACVYDRHGNLITLVSDDRDKLKVFFQFCVITVAQYEILTILINLVCSLKSESDMSDMSDISNISILCDGVREAFASITGLSDYKCSYMIRRLITDRFDK